MTLVSASGICLAGCVDAKVKGIPELAEALEKWAILLPRLTSQIGEEASAVIREMDGLVFNALKEAEKTYGNSLDKTDTTVRNLIDTLFIEVNALGERVEQHVQTTLNNIECSSIAISFRMKESTLGKISFFEKLKFWRNTETVSLTFFDGLTHSRKYPRGNEFSKATVLHELLTEKINHAKADTPISKILDTSGLRADMAFGFYCRKKGSMGGEKSRLWRRWKEAVIADSIIDTFQKS